MSIQLARRTFTVEQFHQMDQMGFFAGDNRLELITGEIVEMSPIGSLHAAAVDRLIEIFSSSNRRCIVRGQNPIRLDDATEPQPDVTLLRRRDDFYASAHPRPADVLLLVEVADTSIDYDREVKIPLYAQAAIAEVWLLNLNGPELVVYSQPVNGKYTAVRYPQPGDTVSLTQLPEATFPADQITGSAGGDVKL